MKRLIWLILLLLPALAAADSVPSPKELLRLAIERAEAKEDAPLERVAFVMETLSTVTKKGELEKKERVISEVVQWDADSTETRTLEEEVIFDREAEEAEEAEPAEESESAEGEKGGRPEESEDDDPGFPFFDREFRERHELRFEEWTELEGREAAVYKVRPLKKKKKDYWKGRICFAADTGALLAYDLEPAKRPFGLKAMRVKVDVQEFAGRDVFRSMDMDLHVKVPFIVNLNIEVDTSFRDFRFIEETGGP